jgi:hypothetical protein
MGTRDKPYKLPLATGVVLIETTEPETSIVGSKNRL